MNCRIRTGLLLKYQAPRGKKKKEEEEEEKKKKGKFGDAVTRGKVSLTCRLRHRYG